MARKERKLSGFDAVAEEEVTEEVTGQELVATDDNNNVNSHVNNNNNVNAEEVDELDAITSVGSPTSTRILRGIYFDDDLVKVIDKLSKGKPRGTKSDIVNAAVRKSFKQKGFLS